MSVLSGCSSWPDALNPVEWYEGATDTVGGWFSGDDAGGADAEPAAAQGGFPNLASVPDRPVPSTTEQQRAQLQQGLVADRDNARYRDRASASTPSAVTGRGQGSGLWPRRGAVPDTRLTTTTTGAVGRDTPPRQTNSLSAESTPTPTPPPAQAANAPATNAPATSVPETRRASTGTVPVPSLGSTPGAVPSAADESPSVIVDGATLDQYQFGVSGPAYLVGTVYFSNGSARLTAEERGLAARIAGAALETDALIRVIGHASSRTAELSLDRHEFVNFGVSLARAEAVAAVLVANGVPEDRVLIEAMSANQPLYFETMPSGEAGNRRAEILLQY